MSQGVFSSSFAGDVSDAASFINVAATCSSTRSLGPGIRSGVWVQGCVFQCPGCIAPDWIPLRPARFVSPEDLAIELLRDPLVTGLTFSGGEPMLQAAGLARLARVARAQRELSIICFTGFQKAALELNPPGPGVFDLLEQVDALIDGPYIDRLKEQHGLRGSTNQKIHYLTGRLKDAGLETLPRRSEARAPDWPPQARWLRGSAPQ